MAAAVFRFGMAFYGMVLVMLVLCNSDTATVSAADDSPTSKPTPTPTTNISSPVVPTTNTTTVSTAKLTSTVLPTTNQSTAAPTAHGNHSTAAPTAHGNHSTAAPTAHGNHSTAAPTTHGNHSTTVSTTNMMSPTPTPEGHGGGDRGKWVATGFAVFFLITTIVMTVLYCRQRKIYRELEGDSSLSRLI